MSDRPRRPVPILATIIVLLLAGIMVALGMWQLKRHEEKRTAIAQMQANLSRPPTSFPALGPVPGYAMFRKSSVQCLYVSGWSVEAGIAADGSRGFRYIAQCVTGAEGPGALIALGIGGKPDLKPAWTGGRITGWITQEPDHRSLFSRMAGRAHALRPMLIASTATAGLKVSAPPRVEDVPDNHLGYAVQWFVFAALALIIYALALVRRTRTHS
jgi:surfeit locus 1 family protein